MFRPAILQASFRPCFLAAALGALAAIPNSLPAYGGWLGFAPAYGAVYWHAHELIYGYVAIVLCGFLFTAIPNWTGRLPMSGWPLAGLVLLWTAGRFAMLVATQPYFAAAAIIDSSFLVALVLVAAREIIAGRNWRNLRVLALVLWLVIGNVVFHVAVLRGQSPELAIRISLGALVVLVTLMGGRLTPSFTHNWLKRRGHTLPPSFSRLDGAAIAASVAGMGAWIVAPRHASTGVLALIAAFLLVLRLSRWRGWLAAREPLLLILHIGYAFLPAGFALVGLAALYPEAFPQGAAVHAWTVGAIGTMSMAVMTRASLGHTGRELTAGPGTILVYVAIVAAALLRIAAAFAGEVALALLIASGLAWTLAFAGFLAVYVPILARPRLN
jgi:uncharacterized protein involved in response to NO